MTIVGPTTADEYLLSFWTREQTKGATFPPTPEARLEAILGRFWYKFPSEGKSNLAWYVCRISSAYELGQLWMHKSDTFLSDKGLWPSSLWLKDLARKAIDTRFFDRMDDIGSCGKNYRKWKSASLDGQLNGHERPLLVQHPFLIDIVDGFGRLLPYLALVVEGKAFHPFEAYLAIPSSDKP
jgi:hypothetical protein